MRDRDAVSMGITGSGRAPKTVWAWQNHRFANNASCLIASFNCPSLHETFADETMQARVTVGSSLLLSLPLAMHIPSFAIRRHMISLASSVGAISCDFPRNFNGTSSIDKTPTAVVFLCVDINDFGPSVQPSSFQFEFRMNTGQSLTMYHSDGVAIQDVVMFMHISCEALLAADTNQFAVIFRFDDVVRLIGNFTFTSDENNKTLSLGYLSQDPDALQTSL
jgi:hypothetical protein